MRAATSQKGLTLIGFAIVLIVGGFFAYAAMKLVPVYTEYFGVVKSMPPSQFIQITKALPMTFCSGTKPQ